MKSVRLNVRLPGVSARTPLFRLAFHAYHGVTAAEHQARLEDWSVQGYRMISLSVYGDPDNPLYAAVWVQRSGRPWAAIHGVDLADYQAFFGTWTAKGYVPVLISATGPANSPIFAAVFEHGIDGSWLARHRMPGGPASNAGTFQNENANALARKMVLRSMASYGTAGDRWYAAVWHPNPSYVKCHVHVSDPAQKYQIILDTETKLPGYDLAAYRPAYVSLSRDLLYCSVFKDDVVGPWVARHGMTEVEYEAELDHQIGHGFYPICTQGGGSTASPVYAAIFAVQEIPLNREWSITGTSIPELTGLDRVMQQFMQANGVRAAQLAVGRNGDLLCSRGYTWAEPGYPLTQPSTRFLLADCSKIFLEAAVQALYDDEKLEPETPVYPLLGFSHPLDPRSDKITIQQLLDHAAGYDDFDPVYNMRTIALKLDLTHPVTKLDVARYMYERMLDFTPGTEEKYSNYDYLLAGAVVEHVSGKSYFEFLEQRLLIPAGISEVRGISTLPSRRSSDDAIPEDQGLGQSPVDLRSERRVPYVYGGDGQINEVGDTNHGMGSSARALVRFIHQHAVWGNGPRAAGHIRTGSSPGASSLACSRSDGVDFAYLINTRDWPPSTSPTLSDIGSSINDLLDRLGVG